jgi:hypothetical protein
LWASGFRSYYCGLGLKYMGLAIKKGLTMQRSNFVLRLTVLLGTFLAVNSFAADRIESVLPAAPVVPAAQSTAELLETGWKVSSERYTQAQEIYQRAKQAAPGDVRVPFAMALVAMKNAKLDEAAKYIDEALPNEKTNFPIRRVDFWIDVQRKDKVAQKSDLQKLAKLLAADKASADRDSYQETARWLGSVMGYYAFTESGRTMFSVPDRAALEANLTAVLTGSLATAFNAGKDNVEQMSKSLDDQYDTARQQSKDKLDAQRAADRQKNETLLSDANQQLAAAQNALTQFQQQSGIDNLETENQSLQGTLSDLKSRRNRLQNMITSHDKEEDRRAQNDKNYRKQTDYADRNDLDHVNRLGGQAQYRLGEIARQLPALRTELNRLSSDVDRKGKAVKTLTGIQNTLAKSPSTSDGASTTLQGKMRMFTTYVPMDLEQEKQRILASYKAK